MRRGNNAKGRKVYDVIIHSRPAYNLLVYALALWERIQINEGFGIHTEAGVTTAIKKLSLRERSPSIVLGSAESATKKLSKIFAESVILPHTTDILTRKAVSVGVEGRLFIGLDASDILSYKSVCSDDSFAINTVAADTTKLSKNSVDNLIGVQSYIGSRCFKMASLKGKTGTRGSIDVVIQKAYTRADNTMGMKTTELETILSQKSSA